ncbi:MAG TPA: methyl-accepting chemotaxis protein [Usitatibacter sp.]|nr:methyl-accepting chemotaxis protein [Usitatibacter sp.]
MKIIADLNTGAKLALAFGLMASLIAVVGFMGIRGMGGMRESMAFLYENEALGALHLKEANVQLVATQGAVRAALLDESADKWIAEVRKADAAFHGEFDKYRATLSRPEDLAKAAEVETLFKELREVQDLVLDLVKAGKGGRARSMWLNLDPLLEVVDGALDELSARKVSDMEKTAQATWASYARRTGLVVSLVLAAITSAVLLGVLITGLIVRPLRGAVRVLESVAGGDLTQRMEEGSRDEVGRMALSLNRALASVNEALGDVSSAADRTAGASRQMSQSASHLARGAQEQATSLEETAASLEEITGTLKQTADHAARASEFALGSRKIAEKGGNVVAATVQAMGEIEASSRRIADITSTVDAIAFQTNLLALNAAVEAARAGEHGRGFAVVAAEVRALAQRSAEAARQIKQLTQDSAGKVRAGSKLVRESGATLAEIVESANRVTELIAEIAGATRHQSSGVDQVNGAVAQMEQLTQSNAAQTEEITATSEALAWQSEHLRELVSRFTLRPGTAVAPLAP